MPFWKSIKNIVRALECYLRRKGRINGVSYTQWALWCSFFRYKLGLFGFLGKMAPTMIVCEIKDRTQIKHSLTKYSTYADADAIAHCFFFTLWQWVSLCYCYSLYQLIRQMGFYQSGRYLPPFLRSLTVWSCIHANGITLENIPFFLVKPYLFVYHFFFATFDASGAAVLLFHLRKTCLHMNVQVFQLSERIAHVYIEWNAYEDSYYMNVTHMLRRTQS